MSLSMLLLALAALIPTGVDVGERWPELRRATRPAPLSGPSVGPKPERHGEGVSIRHRGSGAEAAPRSWWAALLRRRSGGGATPPDPMRLLDAASAFDLLSACLGAGMPPGEAVSATASAVPTRLSGPLHDVSARIALGVASPWTVLETVPELSDLVTLARRSGDSGAAMSAGVAELAVACRASAGDGAEATAERAGVLIAGPLALCFLPAFVVLGLVPTIAGLAGSMLGSLTAGPT